MMSPDDFRRLAAAGLSTEQIAIVMEMMDREARATAAADEARKAKARDRVQRWRDRNVTETSPKVTERLTGRAAPVEDKLLTTEIEPQVRKQEGEALTREALEAYSAMAGVAGLAVPRVVTSGRRARLQAVIREHGLPAFLEAVAKVGASSFCRGENERGWKADLDFILQAKSFPKILEGHYDDRRPRAGPSGKPGGLGSAFSAIHEHLENGQADSDRGDGPTGAAVLSLPYRRTG